MTLLQGKTSKRTVIRCACSADFLECDFDSLHILPALTICKFCDAKKFQFEPPSFCCDKGKVKLAESVTPASLKTLFTSQTCPLATSFRKKIRLYNSVFGFTSFGVKIDKSLATSARGVYTFRVSGQVFHTLPPLVPKIDGPTYFQLYFWENDNELQNRMNVIDDSGIDKEVMQLLMEIMSRNPYAEILRRIVQYPRIDNLNLHISKNAAIDQRCYNAPLADQVAAIWVEGNNPNVSYDRDIIVSGSDDSSHQIKHYFGCYDPLQYPLFFPNGDNGWHQNIPKFFPDKKDKSTEASVLKAVDYTSMKQVLTNEAKAVRREGSRTVSCREYYCFKLQMRNESTSVMLYGGRLLQQFIVDMYVKLETTRLDYYRQNQAEMRSEVYQGIVDSIGRGETRGSEVGQRMVLPASFIGGPRDMRRRYLDAMALVRHYGKPDLFITMTCNPEWQEIKDNLFAGQIPQDRPDLTTRVFRAKLLDLKKQIVQKHIFGKVAAHVYVVEFQKRGLPHAHMLVILESGYKINQAEMFDTFVSAEVPDKQTHPQLFALVVKHMMHGPCGLLNKKSPCMISEKCKSHYPRSYTNTSLIGLDGYPIYRRRNSGHSVVVRGSVLDSRWVVPYNPYLLYRYDCHVNVEVCSGMTAVKYLYKYVYKGHDKVCVNLFNLDSTKYVDEIKQFQDARWVSAPESMWRIFEFDLNEMVPAVVNLPLHLPNRHNVTFWKNQNLRGVIDFELSSKTMLTEFFHLCWSSSRAKELLYSEVPEHYVWDKSGKVWIERKQRRVIGRVNAANPIEGERYYLRMLLLHVRGPTSYDDLLTFNKQMSFSFKEAAQMRGLLECDHGNFECLKEAAIFHMPYSMRRLFSTILVYCNPVDVRLLWESFYDHLSDDFKRQDEDNTSWIMYETLSSIDFFLQSMGKTIDLFDLPLKPMKEGSSHGTQSREIIDELSISVSDTDKVARSHLNKDQQNAYNKILECLDFDKGGMFFVNGPGGTGKTFLYRALLATARERGLIALATATSGVAASILPGGRTAHSRFKIPIDIHEKSMCNVPKQSGLAQLLREAKLIVWDEAPMSKRFAIEAVDRTLQDIVGNSYFFGGKLVVFGGDFMQVLPVIPKANVQETIDGSLVRSYLFHHMHHLSLTENMRAKNDPLFSEFLLSVGCGTGIIDHLGNIKIPERMIIKFIGSDIAISEKNLIDAVYPDLVTRCHEPSYMTDRAILASKNSYVDKLNEDILSLFPGGLMTYISFDEAIDDTNNFYPEEFLNSLNPTGLPPHRLLLKKDSPIMLLRNLNPSDGLCNGTRMVCKQFGKNVIQAEISVGIHSGKQVLIPRIPLSPAENEVYPFQFRRKQFPVRLCFAMTINKAQGQTIPVVGVYLPEPVFSHGQLYVALSRGISMESTKVLIQPDIVNNISDTMTKNVVYREVLRFLPANMGEFSVDKSEDTSGKIHI